VPVFGADITLPTVPTPPGCTDCGGGSGGTVTPSGSVQSNINGAAFAAVMAENKWVQIQGNFLYAGLSASKASTNLQVDASTIIGAAHIGVRIAPDLYVGGGVRRLGLDVKATAFTLPEVDWKPTVVNPIVTVAYTPHLSPKWRLLLNADYGFGSNHSSYAATGSVEYSPAAHFLLNFGYGTLGITVDDTLLTKPIHLSQKLYGPVIGIGIPF